MTVWSVYDIGPKQRMLIGRIDNEVVARCRFVEISDTECHVYSVGVAAEHRRQGIASEAIDLLRLRYQFFSSTEIAGNGPEWWAGYREHRPVEITADPRTIG